MVIHEMDEDKSLSLAIVGIAFVIHESLIQNKYTNIGSIFNTKR